MHAPCPLLALLLGCTIAASEPVSLPDPYILGERLVILAWLQERGVEVAPGLGLDDVRDRYWRYLANRQQVTIGRIPSDALPGRRPGAIPVGYGGPQSEGPERFLEAWEANRLGSVVVALDHDSGRPSVTSADPSPLTASYLLRSPTSQVSVFPVGSSTLRSTSAVTASRSPLPDLSTASNPNIAQNGDVRGRDNDGDGRTESVHVRGYTKADGTVMRSHYRASQNDQQKNTPSNSQGSSASHRSQK